MASVLKARKKTATTQPSTLLLENLMRSSAISNPTSAGGQQRSRSAFATVPSASDLLRVLTDASNKDVKKKKRRTLENGSENVPPPPRPSRKDEIFRTLKAQVQTSRLSSSGTDSPVTKLLTRLEDNSTKKRAPSNGGTKTFSSGIIRSTTERQALANTQSSEHIKGNAVKKTTVKKKKKTPLKSSKYESTNTSEYLAAAEIEDLLGMPIPIQNQIKAVQRDLQQRRREKEMVNLSRTKISEREVDHRQSTTAEKYENNVPSEADDLFFPPAISPKHDDYPILDDKRQEENNMDAMKYVQNALALWVISSDNSEVGTPVTIEKSMEDVDSKSKSSAESKISSEVNTPATPDPFPLDSESTSPSSPLSPDSNAASPRRKPANKSKVTKGKSAVKKRNRPSTADNDTPSTADNDTPSQPCPPEESILSASCPATPDLDENGNRAPEPLIKLHEELLEICSKKVRCTAVVSTQTIYNGNTICTQTSRSMTEVKDDMKIQTKESTQSNVASNGEGNPEISDLLFLTVPATYPVDSQKATSRLDVTCQSKEKCCCSTQLTNQLEGFTSEEIVLMGSCSASSVSPVDQTKSSVTSVIQKISKPCVGTCDGPVAQRSTETSPSAVDDNNNTLSAKTSSSHRVKFSIEKSSKMEVNVSDETTEPNGDTFGFLEDHVNDVGSSCGKTTSEIQATDSLYGDSSDSNNNSGDHPQFEIMSVGEVKCYEQDSQQTVACQPDSPSVHTVGVSGVAKTWSLTAYNHPVKSQPIKQITALREALGYTASTQTIHESNAECQVGHSFTTFTQKKGPQDEEEIKESLDNEEEQQDSKSWGDEDDPRMHMADEVLDSESLLEMSGTIVQKINDLDIGTNIEKLSNTISSTVRAVTEIITDLVQQSEDSLPLNSSENQSLPPVEDGIDEKCCTVSIPEDGEEMKEDESIYHGEARFPTEFYPEAEGIVEERPCAALNPTLSATSL